MPPNHSSRRTVLRIALAALCPAPVLAQNFPSRTVRIVIGFPPGGGADIAARAIQNPFSKALGQPVIVDYRAGANGTIGAGAVAKADPDGHTVLVTTAGAVALSPSLMKNLPFSPLRDLAPIGRVVSSPTVIVLHPSVPAYDIKDLMAQARVSGRPPVIASSGSGSMPHMAIELVSASARVPITHVPYRGAGPALTDVLGGQVQGFAADISAVLPYIRSGKLRAACIVGNARSPLLPDVPTCAEQGLPHTNAENWYGMFAPAKTPPALIDALARALNAALDDAQTRQQFTAAGAVPTPSTPAQLGLLLKTESERWGKLISERNITAD